MKEVLLILYMSCMCIREFEKIKEEKRNFAGGGGCDFHSSE